MTTVAGGNSFRLYPATANNSEASAGNIVIQAAQREQGDIATDYIATTTAAVSVGPVSGLPRLDYYDSTCPRLLLEPQRTNLMTYSEQLNLYTAIQCSVTANASTSPDGYTNADKLVADSGLEGILQQLISITAATHTFSAFAKADGLTSVSIQSRDNASAANFASVSFNLSTGVISTSSGTGAYSAVSGTITPYGSGWYRCTMTFTSSIGTTTRFRFNTPTGDGTSGVLLYGAQAEVGAAYATSYIPTLGTSVTRVKDAAIKSSASAIIGQTEGVIFTEVVLKERSQQICILTSGAGNEANRVQVYGDGTGKIGFLRGDGSAVILSSSTYALGTTLKIAAAYKANDFVLYINGVLQGSDTSVTAPVTPSVIYLGQYVDGTGYSSLDMSQLLLFPTRLSNSDLAALTA
jgi:hypothetical protein